MRRGLELREDFPWTLKPASSLGTAQHMTLTLPVGERGESPRKGAHSAQNRHPSGAMCQPSAAGARTKEYLSGVGEAASMPCGPESREFRPVPPGHSAPSQPRPESPGASLFGAQAAQVARFALLPEPGTRGLGARLACCTFLGGGIALLSTILAVPRLPQPQGPTEMLSSALEGKRVRE